MEASAREASLRFHARSGHVPARAKASRPEGKGCHQVSFVEKEKKKRRCVLFLISAADFIAACLGPVLFYAGSGFKGKQNMVSPNLPDPQDWY